MSCWRCASFADQTRQSRGRPGSARARSWQSPNTARLALARTRLRAAGIPPSRLLARSQQRSGNLSGAWAESEPSFEEFSALARKGSVVPVSRELLADALTPVVGIRHRRRRSRQLSVRERGRRREVGALQLRRLRARVDRARLGDRFEEQRADGVARAHRQRPVASAARGAWPCIDRRALAVAAAVLGRRGRLRQLRRGARASSRRCSGRHCGRRLR